MRFRYLPILLIVCVVIILLYSNLGPFSISSLTSNELAIRSEEAYRKHFSFIFDLRTQKEREETGFYPNSIPISLSTLKDEVPFLLGQKPSDHRIRSTPILVYSNANDGRAKAAAEMIYDMGMIGVRYLSGSYQQIMPPGPLS